MLDFGTSAIGSILLSVGVVVLSILGGVAKLFEDNPEPEDRITRRDWVHYLSSSLLAGVVLAAIVHYYYGASPLLLAVAGISGFGSIQILGVLVKKVIDKLGGDSSENSKESSKKI